MSETTAELPQEVLNSWVWFRCRFGAGLWRCSALTVAGMGTHILQVLSLGKGKKGGGHSTNVTHRRVAAHSSRHTGDRHTSHSQPTGVSWREEMHQHPALESMQLSERCCGGQKQGKQKYTHPSG